MAEAHPNIALVKYWGKRDDRLNLPAAGSISVTLGALTTRTSVCFDPARERDEFLLNGVSDAAQSRRLGAFLDLVRARAGERQHAQVESVNDFPTAAGLASSAAGFAALALAASRALSLDLDARELSLLARQGSGSAARSVFGGFVEMAAGERDDGADAFAAPLLAPERWPLAVVIAITSRVPKGVGSRSGMLHTQHTSPYYAPWIATVRQDLGAARAAIATHDFERLADVAEGSCLAMHAAMLAARPALIYWNAATLACMHVIRTLRHEGAAVFFTIDAGPQVKAVCLPEARVQVARALAAVTGVERVLESGLGEGARVVRV
jgi:diphosphomevalonate decarboxylase